MRCALPATSRSRPATAIEDANGTCAIVRSVVAGFSIARQERPGDFAGRAQARPTQAVIILTAQGEEADRVEGLRRGADDYVVKPFSVKELLAQVEAVLRRSPGRPRDVAEVAIPGGVVDLERHETRFADGQRVAAGGHGNESAAAPGVELGQGHLAEEILASVWQIDSRRCSTRTIDMHIARLREKLRDDPAAPRILLTVRGKGYMFAANDFAQPH